MPAPRGRKRHRSVEVVDVGEPDDRNQGVFSALLNVFLLVEDKRNSEAPKDASTGRQSAFAVFEDAADFEPRPAKKKKRDLSLKLSRCPSALSPSEPCQDGEIDLTSNRTVAPMPVPSLKERVVLNTLNVSNIQTSKPLSRASQLARAMFLSSAPSSTHLEPRLVPRQNDAMPQAIPFPSLLKPPFHPINSNHKPLGPSESALFRRPSDGATLRRPLISKENFRRSSDAYYQTWRKPRSSFIRKATDFAPAGHLSSRKRSLLDDLQETVPKTPISFPRTTRSPSIMSSSEAALIAPIARIPAHLDTPSKDTDQLIADMSDFSLAPNPKHIASSPFGSPENDHLSSPLLGTVEPRLLQAPFGTQSSPGLSIPSIDVSWCADTTTQSSPIRSTAGSSSDPIDLFHPRFLSGQEDTLKPTRLARPRSSFNKNSLPVSSHHTSKLASQTRSNMGSKQKTVSKSVQFALDKRSDNNDGSPLNKWGKLSGTKGRRRFPKSPPRANPMDISDDDDELLLR